jgi:hypothetical protein
MIVVCKFQVNKFDIQWNLGSRTNFSSKKRLGWWTACQIMNTQAGNSGKLRVSARDCQLLVNQLSFGLQTFQFTNGLQERIKFVNRGPTVYKRSPYNRPPRA